MENRRGLTLIEVIISLAIVGIIAMIFLSTFTSGIKNIFSTKKLTEDFYSVENDIDNEIKKINSSIFDPAREKEIKINIENLNPKAVKGELLEVEENGLKIITFVPYNPE